MAREINYDQKEDAHDDILLDKPSGKMTTAQLQLKVAKLYDIVHDFIEYHHTKRPDA
jgi:hypothetical protein|tara:strand:- start:4508 stop:4678 length:171 start_codon:yes stop_codon:yes gene_type:complete